MNRTPRIEVLDAPAERLGECPIWCEREGTLWWVDVLDGALFSHDGGGSRRHPVSARRLGSIALREGQRGSRMTGRVLRPA